MLSPGFLLAIFLLVLNDHVLKQLFHNGLTGKLSDFVGLFAFAVFWLAVLPRCLSKGVPIVVALLFVVWKTELAEPILSLIDGRLPWAVDRVVDWSDFFALAILPVASRYSRVATGLTGFQLAPIGVGVLSLVAFMATSKINVITYYEDDQPTYGFAEPAFALMEVINARFDPDPILSFSLLDVFREKRASTSVMLRQNCIYRADITVKEHGEGSVVSLERAKHHCTTLNDSDQRVQGKDGPVSDAFEKGFIDRLKTILEERKTLSSKEAEASTLLIRKQQ